MSVAEDSTLSSADGWLRDALERFWHETRAFGRTFAAFVFHPGRSAEAWKSGERTFMNPLGFAASAAGIYWAVTSAVTAVWPTPGSDAAETFFEEIASAVGPYLHYGLLGVAMHLGLRGLGSRRSAIRSLGVAFFVGGSVGTLSAVLLSSAARWVGHTRGTSSLELDGSDPVATVFLVAAVACYALVCGSMVIGLNGLRRAPVWKAVLAGGFAVVLTALLFGSVLPEGNYGWRPYIDVDLRGQGVDIGFAG